jgi:hypothetical protein
MFSAKYPALEWGIGTGPQTPSGPSFQMRSMPLAPRDACSLATFRSISYLGSYDDVFNASKAITVDFSGDKRRALLHDNAARVYRLLRRVEVQNGKTISVGKASKASIKAFGAARHRVFYIYGAQCW